MPISEVMQEVFCSAPDGSLLFRTLHIHGVGIESLYLVHEYVPQVLMGIEFEPAQMSCSLPAKAADGAQALRFAVGLVDSRGQRAAEAAVNSGNVVYVTYREFLETERNTPARAPLTMTVTGGDFQDNILTVDAQYFDLLNLAWPRERYTIDKAPGVKYL